MRRAVPWISIPGVIVASAIIQARVYAQEDPARQAYLEAVEAAKDAPVEQAIALYQQVIDEFPGTNFAANAMIAQTGQYIAGNMPDEALANAERALAEYGDTRIAGQAITQKSHVLLHMMRRPREALEFLIDVVPQYEHLFYPFNYTQITLHEYDAQFRLGERAGALDSLAQGALHHPQLLNGLEFFRRYIPALLAAGMQQEALSAAKAHFACCAFNETEIKHAADKVVKCWMGLGELEKAGQFLAAQEDPAAENPLADVAWPQIGEENLEFMLDNVAGDVSAQIALLLYAGDCDEAFNLATAGLADAKEAAAIAAWIERIARCLKGQDLSIARANAFLKYIKAGEGENPLRDQ